MIGIATIFINISPLITGQLATEFELPNARIGELMALPLFVSGGVLISQIFWLRAITNWRVALFISIVIASTGYLLATFAQGYLTLLASFVLLGLGFGGMYGICMTLIGDSKEPDKGYGTAQLFQKIISIILLLGVQLVVAPLFGFSGTMILIMTISLLCLTLLRLVPPKGINSERPENTKSGSSGAEGFSVTSTATTSTLGTRDLRIYPSLMAGLAIAFLMIGFTGLWVFTERLASAAGLSAGYIGISLASASVIASAGTFVPIYFSDRYGRIKPMIGATLFFILSLLIYEIEINKASFLIASVLTFASYAVAAPYAFGSFTSSAHNEKIIIAMPSLVVFSSGIGPAIAGWIYSGDSTILLVFSGLCILACLVLVIGAETMHKRLGTDTSS